MTAIPPLKKQVAPLDEVQNLDLTGVGTGAFLRLEDVNELLRGEAIMARDVEGPRRSRGQLLGTDSYNIRDP